MDFYTTIGIAAVLAVDASIVAFSYGLILHTKRFVSALKLATVTGVFQATMPIVGFWLTGRIHSYIEACDHWIAFGIFSGLGGFIIFNAWRASKPDTNDSPNLNQAGISVKKLLGIGLATSIDALAVGAGMACMKNNNGAGTFSTEIGQPAAIIGIITFLCVISAFYSTHLLKNLPKRMLETIAGIILISLGTITLIQHTLLAQ